MDELIDRYAKIPSAYRYLGMGGVFILCLALFYVFFYTSEQDRLVAIQAEYVQLQQERDSNRQATEDLARASARLVELEEDFKAARATLPDNAKIPQFLAQLGNTGRESGLRIDRFEPKDERSEEFISEIAFEMSVNGSFHEIATFIDSVGRLDRIINVSNIRMGGAETVGKEVVLKAELDVKTYRFLSKDEMGKAGKKK